MKLYNEDLERSILSCMLLEEKANQDVILELTAEDFVNTEHKTIFQAMVHLFKENCVCDLITLKDYMEKTDLITFCGGVQNLLEISSLCYTTTGLKTYIKRMVEYRHRRMGLDFISRVQKSIKEEDIKAFYNTISSIPDFSESDQEESTEAILQASIDRMVERKNKPKSVKGLDTGFIDLDRTTGGVKRGELILVSAPPNVGKSVITKDVSIHFAKKERQVLSFNFEMVNENIGDRLLSSATPLEVCKIDNPALYFTKQDLQTLRNNDDTFKKLNNNLHVYSKMRNRTLEAIRIKCKEAIIKFGSVDLVVIDYLQKMQGEGEERERIERNIGGLAALAKEFNCVVMVISSLTRDQKLKGSTNIEFDADQWWQLVRNHSDKDEIERCKTELIVEKNRNGGKGHIKLVFDEKHIRFLSASR